MIILLHSSKTMRAESANSVARVPQFHVRAVQLAAFLQSLNTSELGRCMHMSPTLAAKTHQQYLDWNEKLSDATPAVDSFIGDIYSGLQVHAWSNEDRDYADEHLRILSGLYGILRPLDGVRPYRLEMGYVLPAPFGNLYNFWGDSIAATLPPSEYIVNAAAIEYSKTVTPFVDAAKVITPKFLTRNAKTGEPAFVTVHAKIARGAFARWLIVNRVDQLERLCEFNSIGYKYDKTASTSLQPVFVCEEFGGKGLSVRLGSKPSLLV